MADDANGDVGTAPTLSPPSDATMTSPGRASAPALRDRVWIGRYKVIAKLGAGGMGEVYAAEDPELDRKVAIKLLHATSETASARLVREARALAKLRHPNVVTIYEVGRDSGDAFVAMELVEGVTLREWLQGEHRFSERLDAMLQAGRGLVAAHAEGLVHRDFKPENVMVGKDGRVQVLDFGLAKTSTTIDPDAPPARPSSDALDGLTRTGTLLGTPAYMAPEQFAAAETDARTDQFAYCVALFEALHGFRPFAGHSQAALAEAVAAGRITPDRALSTQVPPHVQAAILRGLSVEPARRFPAMTALLAALEAKRRGSQRWFIGIATTAAIAAAGVAYTLSRPTTNDDAALFTASGVPAPQPVPVAGDPFKVTVHTLSNGLSVWVSPNRKSPRIDARLVVRAGSRDANGVAGLAHMVEHMTYKGTSRIGTTDFAQESVHLAKLRALYAAHVAATGDAKAKLVAQIDAETVAASRYENASELLETTAALGIRDYGAVTDHDSSVFRADVPSNKFAAWAKLEGERLSDPVFRAFHVEAGVVFDEVHGGRSRGAEFAVYEELLTAAFANHPYELAPGGTFAGIVAEPFTAAEAFHRTWYVPNNAALLLAGDIDPEQAIPVLERELARWKPRALPRREPRPIAPLAGEVQRTVKGMQMPLVLVGWHGVPLGHPDEEALLVLSALGDRLGEKHAEHARLYTYPWHLVEAGLIGITALPVGGHSQDEALGAIDDIVRALQAGAFSDEMLAGVLLNQTILLERAHDTNDARIQRMIGAYLGGRGWAAALGRKARIGAVTKADVVRVANRYLTKQRVVVRTELGKFEMPAVTPLVITPLDASPKRPSPFVTALLAEESVEIPPRFVAEGRDYATAETPAGTLVAVANRDDAQYVLRMTWDLGSRQLPLLCGAVHALERAGIGDGDVATRRARWFARAQTATVTCGPDAVELEVTGVDGTFDEDVRDVERWLAGGGVTDAVWKAAAGEYVDLRTWYQNGDAIIAALDQYAAFGASSSMLVGATSAQLKRATAGEAREVLQTLASTRRTIAYFGPRTLDRVPIPPGVMRASPPRARVALAPITGTRILTVDTGANRSVTATIRVPLGVASRAELAAPQVFAKYLSGDGNGILWNAFRNVRGITYSGGTTWIEEPERTDDDTSLVIRFSTTAEQLAAALELVIAQLRAAYIDPAQAALAQRRSEEAFRANWISPRDLPAAIASWRARGLAADPRAVTFEETRRTGERELAKVAAKVAGAPTYVSITGDIARVDLARLRALGTVEPRTVSQLFVP